jgi:hypothetical protein
VVEDGVAGKAVCAQTEVVANNSKIKAFGRMCVFPRIVLYQEQSEYTQISPMPTVGIEDSTGPR